MNWLLLVAAAVAAFTTVGHFVIGRKLYLLPMLAASFDEVARKVMHAVFHYVSVFLLLSTAALGAGAFGVSLGDGGDTLFRFIALNKHRGDRGARAVLIQSR
ncbi:MAG: hypothetical protein KKA32_12115 [Actinobacteria bacterium]|nr:hypothetical protein [Actinomycetota bacterium]